MKRIVVVALLLVAIVPAMSGCAPGPNEAIIDAQQAAGFWLGLWHGLVVAITFVVSLFSDSVNIYEVNNTGGWYNFGFVLGIIIAFGGGGKRSGRVRKRETRDIRS